MFFMVILEDINLIEGFKGFDIKISEDQQQDLEDGSYYYHQIIGLDAVTLDGEKIGKISENLVEVTNALKNCTKMTEEMFVQIHRCINFNFLKLLIGLLNYHIIKLH